MSAQPADPLPHPALLEALQRDNAQLQRQLLQARAELEEFTASVSHDLRASLRHVNAYVQIIQEDLGDAAPAGIVGHLGTVSQAARHMGRQIDGLTALSRLNQVALQWSPVALAPLVRDVCAELAPALNGRALDWQVAEDCPALQCDAALLRQVLMHLLSNACKFTAPRAVAEVKVTWQHEGDGHCALTVADNGVGFNPGYSAKLFHVFQRLHGAREFEGLGMGLALTRKIIERHGGTVRASGAVDAGCSVSFTLPLA
jgi:light-regulated signal transduction histidine kinase (bacteriophytochrome)